MPQVTQKEKNHCYRYKLLNIFVPIHILMLSSKRSNRVVQVVPFMPSFTINVSLRSEFCVVMSVAISTQKRCSVRLYLQLFVGGLMSYLRYLYLLMQWCPTLIVLCFYFAFLCLVYTMVPVSLHCPFLIAPNFLFDILQRLFIQY